MALRDRWPHGRRTDSFTLQWHLTNACERSCAHCYDRSDRSFFELPRAIQTLNDLLSFCERHAVRPHVSLTGGNPFLHPHFFEIYDAVVSARIPVTILGNPVPREHLRRLVEIQKPRSFQVSLEGLAEHNDSIRGRGHFQHTVEFLLQLKELGIRSNVMLTLTKANIDQVLPLGQLLLGVADRFTFNRLAHVGGGAGLSGVSRQDFRAFLHEYLHAAESNPILGRKENLLGTVEASSLSASCRGCTGFGCGAAFNFVALLPDGEVHACRKFPSSLGSIRESSFEQLWSSREARRYRQGPRACSACSLRNRCGGCYAVMWKEGVDVTTQQDPHCSLSPAS